MHVQVLKYKIIEGCVKYVLVRFETLMCSILYNVSGLMGFSFVVRDVDNLDVIMAILFELCIQS